MATAERTRANEIGPSPADVRRRPRDWIVAAAIGFGAMLAFLVVNLPNLLSHQLVLEDFGHVVQAGRWFGPDFFSWFTEGNQQTVSNYLELGPTGNFKPVQNFSLYLDSLVAPHPQSPMLFLTNYLGLGLIAALSYLFARRVLGFTVGWAVLSGVLVGGTLATDVVFTQVSFRGDMLAALLGLLALFTADAYLRTRLLRYWALTIGILIVAVLTKENALAAPLVVGAFVLLRPLIVGERRSSDRAWLRSRLRTVGGLLVSLAIPLAAYGFVRIFLFEGSGASPWRFLGDSVLGVPMWLVRPFQFLASAFFPIEVDALQDLAAFDLGDPLILLHALAALALNVVLWILAVRAFRRGEARVAALALMGALAVAVPLVSTTLIVRYTFLSQVIMVPLAVLLVLELRDESAWLRKLLVPAAVALIVVGPVYTLAALGSSQSRLVERNDQLALYEPVLEEVFADPDVGRVYLVNDPGGQGGGLGKLRYYALGADRDDVVLRMVNRLENYDPSNPSPAEGVEFVLLADGRMRVTTSAGGDERFFGAIVADQVHRLGDPGVIEYGPFEEFSRSPNGRLRLADQTMSFFIPDAARTDFVVVGLDPSRPGVHVYRSWEGSWSPV